MLSRARPIVLLLALVLALSGCAGGDGGGADRDQPIRVALDWTPNTNHIGLFAAQQAGYFRDAGLDVEFLPYNQTSPDTLVGSGAADFGISFQSSFTYSRAAGADITSVMAVLQHWATEIAVRADRADIRSPRDLDGKVYAGFGEPGEVAKMQAVIRNDGGRGDIRTEVLNTAAYEALYAGQADFTEPFVNVEGIEAQLRGEPLKTFRYTDCGFPDAYNVLLVGNSTWLQQNPDRARAFVQAAQRGYALAAQDPAGAARMLSEANPGAFTDDQLVDRGATMLADGYLRDEQGRVGFQTPEKWSAFSGFLYDTGTVAGPDGAPVREKPDFSTWFTNDYLTP
ncbi:ABC transporter permease [Pseudonocardia sp. EC080610-09]|uniref:ABC transporter substrate-binding protein n=1 Tax=unclassified Pseudonocardia TaxID=2619320 RepID=UPI000705783A|nr:MULTISPECIES: ABC transporter substrate-binding protein [unclassified Pseudonocardia]ALL77344.1 ABC transporter permease [Pseudonocardia sp. EC080610-09]ALL80260.1 ABC transporter permease [Pseudonocardia sp. EC080619-01]